MALDDMVVKVGPQWEPWPERAPRPPQPQLAQTWPREPQARWALEDLLAPYGFVLVPEVRLREPRQPYQYIDYVMICPESWPVKVVGIEVKRGFPKLMHGLDAIDQARRYRKTIIVDDRVSVALGDRLEHVFIWPRLDWGDDCVHQAGARAARVHAGRANVGSIDAEYVWRYGHDNRDAAWQLRVRFMLGQETFWTSRGFEMLDGHLGAGAKRIGDPSRGMRSVE